MPKPGSKDNEKDGEFNAQIPVFVPQSGLPVDKQEGVNAWLMYESGSSPIDDSPDMDDAVWIPIRVLSQSGPLLTIREGHVNDKQGNGVTGKNRAMQVDLRERTVEPANPIGGEPKEDMTSLYYINEPGILYNLEQRAFQDEPYTNMGNVMVAVNPLRPIPDPPGSLGSPNAKKHPHPYAVAENAYAQLSFNGDNRRKTTSSTSTNIINQSVVTSGESGAGKTESSKMVLKHIVKRTSGGSTEIDIRLLKSNPITEALGNAATLRNPNSSRFGKFMKMHLEQLDTPKGTPPQHAIRGASVETYLLERSRVTLHNEGERNFHMFYQLLAGADSKLRSELYLDEPGGGQGEFRILGAKNDPTRTKEKLRKKEDAEDFKEVQQSLEALEIGKEDSEALFRTVAGVMHLANVDFEDEETMEGDVAKMKSSGTVSTYPALKRAATLFGVNETKLEELLTKRHVKTRAEGVLTVPRNARGASFARDAVAKSVYSQLFEWMIRRIDQSLDDSAGHVEVSSLPFIGVLDIFGFESFEKNGFEQLLINFANESLQATFNRQVFNAELDLYKQEGLVLDTEMDAPPDNSKGMELLIGEGASSGGGGDPMSSKIKGRSPLQRGLLLTIDDESQTIEANDTKLNNTLHKHFSAHDCFPKPHPRDKPTNFLIRHFAGKVQYTVEEFVEKNIDSLPEEVNSLFSNSNLDMVSKLFLPPPSLDAEGGGENDAQQQKSRGKGKPKTVVGKFTGQIQNLIDTLESTKCSFIRCVKPNASMLRGEGNNKNWFNRKYVAAQLRNLSIPQTAEVLKSGLPTRVPYSSFVESYEKALPSDAVQTAKKYKKTREEGDNGKSGSAQNFEKLFTAALFFAFELGRSSYKLGHTRVFFAAGELAQLDHVLSAAATWAASGDSPEKDKVAKRFRYYFARRVWRQIIAKVIACNKFIALLKIAQAKNSAGTKVLAFMRMVPPRKKFLKHIESKKKNDQAKKAQEKKEAEKRKKEQEEQRKKELEQQQIREKEEEEQRQLQLAMDKAKEDAKKEAEREARLEAKREAELEAQREAHRRAEEIREELKKEMTAEKEQELRAALAEREEEERKRHEEIRKEFAEEREQFSREKEKTTAQLQKLQAEKQAAEGEKASAAEQAEQQHREALASRILAQAVLREKEDYERQLSELQGAGKEDLPTDEEREAAVAQYEKQLMQEMARYEAYRRHWAEINQKAKDETALVLKNIKAWVSKTASTIASTVVANHSVQSLIGWVTTRYERMQSEDGIAAEMEDLHKEFNKRAAQAQRLRMEADKKRRQLFAYLKKTEWYQRALERQAKIEDLASRAKKGPLASSIKKVGLGIGQAVSKYVLVDKNEWDQPLASGNAQIEKLKQLMEEGQITPDEFADMSAAILRSVEQSSSGRGSFTDGDEDYDDEKSRGENQKAKRRMRNRKGRRGHHHPSASSDSGYQYICEHCGEESNTALGLKCETCGATRVPKSEQDDIPEDSDDWTIPLPVGLVEIRSKASKGKSGKKGASSKEEVKLRCCVRGSERVHGAVWDDELIYFTVHCEVWKGGKLYSSWQVASTYAQFGELYMKLVSGSKQDGAKNALTKTAIKELPPIHGFASGSSSSSSASASTTTASTSTSASASKSDRKQSTGRRSSLRALFGSARSVTSGSSNNVGASAQKSAPSKEQQQQSAKEMMKSKRSIDRAEEFLRTWMKSLFMAAEKHNKVNKDGVNALLGATVVREWLEIDDNL